MLGQAKVMTSDDERPGCRAENRGSLLGCIQRGTVKKPFSLGGFFILIFIHKCLCLFMIYCKNNYK